MTPLCDRSGNSREAERHHLQHILTHPHLADAVQECLTLQVYGTLAFKLYGTLLLAIVSVAKSGA
jgi:hypothetical protein